MSKDRYRASLRNDAWFLNRVKIGHISVSKSGVVVNNWTGNTIGAVQRAGYVKITLAVKEYGTFVFRHMQVHRLVWLVYKGKIPKRLVINHKNGVKVDNRLKNLECVSYTENSKHAYRTGLQVSLLGEEKVNSKFSDALVRACRQMKESCVSKEARVKLELFIAKACSCHRVTVHYMLVGRTYASV